MENVAVRIAARGGAAGHWTELSGHWSEKSSTWTTGEMKERKHSLVETIAGWHDREVNKVGS